ncbi:hypothetical protein ACFXD5_06530 [Streptomyces sp. NPDC059385]|uniref:hypothetical protein n=1 Tax=Streptomyces sp. NPDC059385 TaxID=3346817 RepID=UPI0036CDE5E7
MPDDVRPLTAAQLAVIDFAKRDLDDARTADLAAMEADALIILVERLRGRLYDVLSVFTPCE